jgi:trimethylamine---corrinoid protein Co-methyltransferase
LPSEARCNILYGMGMMELGITMSYEQLLIDREIARMNKRVMQGITVNEDTLAVELIKAVGPGGNYLGERHTVKYMRQESSKARLIDRSMRQNWEKAGSKDMFQRAREEALEILNTHRPLPLEPEAAKKIRAIVEEAEAELASTGKWI